MKDRVPPHDLESERRLIGSCMLDRDSASALAESVSPDHFYRDAHGFVWQAVQACERAGVVADTHEVRCRLVDAGKLAAVGGDEVLLWLTDVIPTLANAEALARRVRDLSAARSMIAAAQLVLAEGYDGIDDVGDYLARSERAISRAAAERVDDRDFMSLGDASADAYGRLVARQSGKLEDGAPIATGLHRLDNSLGGGFWPGDLVIVAGRPGSGKSAFALQRCAREAGRRALCAFFSLEMPAYQLGSRAMAADAGIDSNLIRTSRLSSDDMRRLEQSRAMGDATVWIDDVPGATIGDVRRKTMRLQRKRGAVSMVVVDYLQLMRAVVKSGSREQDVSEISRSLKELAKELAVPVVALCQMNRDFEKRGKDAKPQLSDLRESGAIEQDADTVLFIHRQELADKENAQVRGLAEIIIGKQRAGITGVCEVAFRSETTSFENLEAYR